MCEEHDSPLDEGEAHGDVAVQGASWRHRGNPFSSAYRNSVLPFCHSPPPFDQQLPLNFLEILPFSQGENGQQFPLIL